MAGYVTPTHQFPLGMSMPVERRLSLLSWAYEANAFVIEDDYDSEYRFEGRPLPALQGLDKRGSVIFLGSFSKVLFPALRLGYVVLPARLLDPVLGLRVAVDSYPLALLQATLCDFMTEGHLGRHIRKMREMYANRLGVLQDAARKHLGGLLDISSCRRDSKPASPRRCGRHGRGLPRPLELLKAGEFRAEAHHLGLEQELPADACVDIFFLADLKRILEQYGNRLEAGAIGGKMYLAAYAQHLGATGLTFFDDDVITFFSPHTRDESAIFLLAIGKALKRKPQ